MPLWSPASSLVFTASLQPKAPTQTSTPKVFSDTSKAISASGQPNISLILADLEVSISPADQYKPDTTYMRPSE